MIKFTSEKVERETDIPTAAKKQPNKTTYRPEYVERVRGYCILGATKKQICELLDTTAPTLDAWIATFPAFADAMRNGLEADHKVAASLFQRACGYTIRTTKTELIQSKGATTERTTITEEHVPADVPSAWRWMSLRRGWHEQTKDTMSADDLIEFARLARAEAARRGIDFASALRDTPRNMLAGQRPDIDDDPAGNAD